ncbi:MAG: ATP-dependent Clp protease ATP-binding subunit ClpX, partial [Planctomycetes bacterium]|nr:ATP-dependent Clp protease ATP-binding subunit ClpX [Planctomycetota bacterium]
MAKQTDHKRTKKAVCSFCGQSGSRTETLIEGPENVYICPDCVELCHNIIRQNRKQSAAPSGMSLKKTAKPREMKAYLDRYVIGQDHA